MSPSPLRRFSSTERREISILFARDGKIAAIPYLRNWHNIGRREAKLLIENFLHCCLPTTIFGSIGGAMGLAVIMTAVFTIILPSSNAMLETARFGSDL